MRYTPRTQHSPFGSKNMYERTSRTGASTASSEHFQASSGDLRSALQAMQDQFRPCRVGLLLLAFAVALFAFGYKASLFQYRSHQIRSFPVAKAVVEQHRFGHAPLSAYSVRHRTRLQFEIDPQNLLGQTFTSLPVFTDNAPRIFAPPRALPFFDSALPLRSPPSFAA